MSSKSEVSDWRLIACDLKASSGKAQRIFAVVFGSHVFDITGVRWHTFGAFALQKTGGGLRDVGQVSVSVLTQSSAAIKHNPISNTMSHKMFSTLAAMPYYQSNTKGYKTLIYSLFLFLLKMQANKCLVSENYFALLGFTLEL